MNIQKERFGERIQFSLATGHGIDSFLVPCMILQPLVENAIMHGLESKEEGGTISIDVRKRNNMIRAVVEDNGTGFDPAATTGRDDKIGLNSTRSRLAHHFGANHRFLIKSRIGKGTVITIDIPAGENHE